ncbi:MAG: alcohol dehydrogenase catalytic domain-containing protein, partial [Anaerolineae bacterium]|nr:alcohol dehydrogenase catalytic domain-containing protein [Anaerolineae bacterium]
MSDIMPAVVYHGPHDLRVEERSVPAIGPQEALLKVASAGVCGTDLRIYKGGHRKHPADTVRVPGHEVVRDIVEVGADVRGLQIGQRVFVAPNMGCGHCHHCVSGRNNRCANFDAFGVTIDGAFAEYLRIPAASLIEPFACVLHGQDLLDITPTDVVLVVGAGPIGLMHAMLARLCGSRRIIMSDVVSARLELAAELVADRIVNPTEEDLPAVIAEETHGEGADIVIVAAPAPVAQQQALELAVVGGRNSFFGGLPKGKSTIQFDSNLVHYKELCATGTSANSTNDCLRAAQIINSGRVDLSS